MEASHLKARALAKVFSFDSQRLAAELEAINLKNEVGVTFSEAMRRLCADDRVLPRIAECAIEWALDDEIVSARDVELGYMGIDTLRSKYLLRSNEGDLLETPQYLFMRVSVAKHPTSKSDALKSYDYMSRGLFTHATPTLMSAGTPNGSLASCYLMHIPDSLDGIFEGVSEAAQLSRGGGGIGIDITHVRASGSHIQGSNGKSNGIRPMLNVFNATMSYVDQGGGKRKGVAAVYMEPWHADILDLVRLRDPRSDPMESLFPALWVNDIFMERVRDDEQWNLYDPADVPGFTDAYGPDFTILYEECDATPRHTMRARELYQEIITMQLRSGTPYMHSKHACNRSSNHAHLGTIMGSNLCGEIMQKSSSEETAMCNLASINVSAFCGPDGCDLDALRETVRFVVQEIDIVIETTTYRSERSKRSNMTLRPMGIGIQGLADAFVLCGFPFDSPEALDLSTRIAENMYFAAINASIDIQRHVRTPLSEGILHFDHYPDAKPTLDWEPTRARLIERGAAHSVFIAFMPTASTSRILGNNECFDPYHRLLYMRRTLSGEYLVSSKHFLRALHDAGIRTPEQWSVIGDALNTADGRPRLVDAIPDHVKRLFPTIWDVKRRFALDMVIGRAPYVDQAESMSLYVDLNGTKAPRDNLYKQQMYAWKNGLKTISYYTHQNTRVKTNIGPTLSGGHECLMCGS